MQKPLQNRGSMEGLELIPQHRRQMHKTFSPGESISKFLACGQGGGPRRQDLQAGKQVCPDFQQPAGVTDASLQAFSMRFCQKGLSIMKVYLQSMLSRCQV